MAILNVAMTAIKVISKMSAKKAVSSGAKKFITNKAKEKVKSKIKDKFLGKKDKKEKGGALAIRPSSAIMVSGSTPLLPSTSASNPFDSKSDKSSSIIKKPTEKVNFEKLTESINNIVRITEDLNDASKKQLENDKDILEDERKRRQEAARKRRESLLESGKKVAGSAVKGAAAVGEKFDLMKFFENILLGGAFLAIINLLSGNQKTLDNLSQNIFRIYKVLPKLLKFLFDPLGIFETIFKGIKKLLSPLTNTIKTAVSNLTNKVKEVLERGFKNLGNAITDFVDELGKKLKNAFDEALEQAAKQADELVEAALKRAEDIKKAAQEQAERLIREATENLIKPGQEALEQGAKSMFSMLSEGAQKRLTTVSQGAQQLVKNVQTGASNVVEFGKNLGKRFISAVDGVKNSVSKFGSSVIEGAQNVGKSITGFAANQADKALEVLEERIKPAIQEILEKNPLLKKISSFVSNPKEAGKRVTDFVRTGVQEAATNPRLLDTLDSLKKARSAAGGQLGPLDKIITVIESVVRYGMGEAPVNAIALALANLFGYAAGFAAASLVPGLGQSGIFNMMGGIAGSIAAEEMTKFGLSKLLQAAPALGEIEDPISKKVTNYQKRPLLRDPTLSFEEYRKSINMEGGKFLGMKIPNLLGGDDENTTQNTSTTLTDTPKPRQEPTGASGNGPRLGSSAAPEVAERANAGYKRIYDLAKQAGDPFPEVTAAQWAIESGYGKYKTGKNNPFGQTGTHPTYGGTTRPTPRDPGGGSKTFMNFGSESEAVAFRVKRWVPEYGNATTPHEALMNIQKHGGNMRYAQGFPTAAHPEGDWMAYVRSVSRVIKENGMDPQRKAKFDTTSSPSTENESENEEGTRKYFESGGKYYAMDESQRYLGDTEEEAKKKTSGQVEKIMREKNMSQEEAERYISSDMESGPSSEQSDMTDTPPVLERGTGTNSEVTTTTNQQLDQPRSEEYASGSMDASPVSTPDLSTPGSSGGGDPQSAQLSQPRSEEYASGGGSGGGGVSTAGQSTAQSLSRRASYEQGADQELVIPLPQQQNNGGGMIRSKSKVMMMGSDSLNRYYKAQLLGALYKRG